MSDNARTRQSKVVSMNERRSHREVEFSLLLKKKDAVIQAQAKRIQDLESEVARLRKERVFLSTKLTLLSYKLSLAESKNEQDGPETPKDEAATPTNNDSEGAPLPPPRASSFKERASSVGNSPAGSPRCTSPRVVRQPSTGGNQLTQKQRSFKRSEEDEKLKRSRGWANAYELSQDLHEKQLEMLERKYGGIKARRAARVIQQAFRQYCMTKNFQKLRTIQHEKRLSRRYGEFTRSHTIWSDMVVSRESYSYLDGQVSSKDLALESKLHLQKSSESLPGYIETQNHVPSMGQQPRSLSVSAKGQMMHRDRKPLQRSMGLDLSTVSESKISSATEAQQPQQQQPGPSPAERNNNRNSYPELNDSSASDSPQETPIESAVDLHSVNFENLLESKETDILNDSFHSDSSQEAGGHSYLGSPHRPGSSVDDLLSEQAYSGHEKNRTYVSHGEAPGVMTTSANDIQITVEEIQENSADNFAQSSDSDRTPTRDEHHDGITRVYGNSEVKLRKRKGLSAPPDTVHSEPTQVGSSHKKSDISPIWKRKSAMGGASPIVYEEVKRMSNISETSEPDSVDGSSPSSDTASMGSEGGMGYHRTLPSRMPSQQSVSSQPRMSDRQRKRMYRIGLNLFNKKPEKGIRYLVERRFLDDRPQSVARFLNTRKGLSKQMIGEYLGNLQNPFNMETLQCFCAEIDLSGLQVDVALRKFQSYFRMPGEAQKIERLMEGFAHRYCCCNMDQVKKFRTVDTVFLLAFSIIMLNTDLHNASIKPTRKMKLEDFIKNLRGIDEGEDVDRDLLTGIYERVATNEFKPGSDHVTQVVKVEQMIVGKKPVSQLALPHRRLVCYCRLYEVHDPNKREKLSLHQREVFLFNDMLMVTKVFSKKKNNTTYSFRQSYPLCGMQVYLFETPHYQHGIRLTTNIDGKVLITFNARNEHDRTKFVEDLKEAILEMNEMESLRIEEELSKQKLVQYHNQKECNRYSKDSGVVDMELLKVMDGGNNRLSAPECGGLRRSALSNSLIDISDGKGGRRGSGGSLDSGMASTGSGSTGSREDSPHQNKATKQASSPAPSSSFRISGIFGGKKGKEKVPKASVKHTTTAASEV